MKALTALLGLVLLVAWALIPSPTSDGGRNGHFLLVSAVSGKGNRHPGATDAGGSNGRSLLLMGGDGTGNGYSIQLSEAGDKADSNSLRAAGGGGDRGNGLSLLSRGGSWSGE